ncbi:phage portal protein family protein, partial [Avibacterium paragallinarum]
ATPWLVGKHPRQTQPHEIEDLLDSMEKMLGTAVAAIPNDSTIELLESGSKGGSSQVFDDFLRYCKSEIAIAILGQNQTTEAEANRASATAGLEVAKAIRDEDAAIVESCFNQLLRWICKLNFNVDTLPTFELFEQESIDKLQAERDQLLASMGVQFSEQYLARTYGFEQGDITLKQQPLPQQSAAQKSAEFNEPAPTMPRNIADGIVEQLEIEAESHVDNWLQAVQDKLASAESLEDFRTQLDSLIPELDFSEYAQVMAWASTSAELAGRYSVNKESKKER